MSELTAKSRGGGLDFTMSTSGGGTIADTSGQGFKICKSSCMSVESQFNGLDVTTITSGGGVMVG